MANESNRDEDVIEGIYYGRCVIANIKNWSSSAMECYQCESNPLTFVNGLIAPSFFFVLLFFLSWFSLIERTR